MADDRSLDGLIVEAGIQGVAMPLTSAAVGGIFGVALWFTPAGRRFSPAARSRAVSAVVVAVGLFVVLGLLDVSPFSNSLYVGGYLLIAVLALLALRIALQAALLHEAHDSTGAKEQLRCADCDHVVPHTAFCSNCGVATRASPRTSRDQTGTAPVRRAGYTRVLGTVAVVNAAATAIAVVVSMLITPDPHPISAHPSVDGRRSGRRWRPTRATVPTTARSR